MSDSRVDFLNVNYECYCQVSIASLCAPQYCFLVHQKLIVESYFQVVKYQQWWNG